MKSVAERLKHSPEITHWKRHLASLGYAKPTIELRILFALEFKDITGRDIPNTHAVAQYLDRLADSSVSPATRSAKIISVRLYLKWLRTREQIFYDPVELLPTPRSGKPLPRAILTEREVSRIFTALGDQRNLRPRAMIELFYSGGLRRSELLNLDLYDLDMSERTVMVRAGKGNKDRLLPLPATAIRTLKRYLRENRLKIHTHNTALFIKQNGERIKTRAVDITCRRIRQKTGLKKPLSPHIFRHSIATHLMRRGVDIRYIQAFLGHADIRSTQIYTRVVPNDIKRAIDRCHPRNRMT